MNTAYTEAGFGRYELKPVTARVGRVREHYRSSVPVISIERYRLITEFYMANPQLTGVLRQAKSFEHICQNIPPYIGEDELIVGSQGTCFRAITIYPEYYFSDGAIYTECLENRIRDRKKDYYEIDDESIAYIAETGEFWRSRANGALVDAYIPEFYAEKVAGNGVITFKDKGNSTRPVGHFCADYNKVIRKGLGAVKAEAEDRMAQMEGRIFGSDMDKYNFYRGVAITCGAMITLAKRYSAEAARLAALEKDEKRRAELEQIARTMDRIMEKPCRTFREAVQALYFYHTCMALDGNLHGMTLGRVDQYLGDFYDRDIATGVITPEEAQELLDLACLKFAQMSNVEPYGAFAGLGYTSGSLMTIGGVDKNGDDATNEVTYMILRSAGRLVLHDPPIALRIHKNTPQALWEAGIETTKIAGGVPTFESDDVIIPSLMHHGFTLADAREYCLIGCVEPGGCGNEWTCAGGTGMENFFNLANCLLLAVNNGYNPMPTSDGSPAKQTGLATGYLSEMASFDDVLAALWKQMEYFIDWQMTLTNSFEYVTRQEHPVLTASATIDGCMESGRDVMFGGAKYNSSGMAGIAIGNIVDSLAVIRHMVYDEKVITGEALLRAVTDNWEGREDLRQYILNECPHYGNGIEWIDRLAHLVGEKFQQLCDKTYGYRCKMRPGLWPVTMNVLFGFLTHATFDGRKAGTPLADGISPVQGLDKNGPTAILQSVAHIDQSKLGNGTLLNMRFHPATLQNPDGKMKLENLMKTYFDLGGMELQINITDTKTLREAQKKPEDYKDLVVRVAGFSVYFTELFEGSQNDIIARTELSMT